MAPYEWKSALMATCGAATCGKTPPPPPPPADIRLGGAETGHGGLPPSPAAGIGTHHPVLVGDELVDVLQVQLVLHGGRMRAGPFPAPFPRTSALRRPGRRHGNATAAARGQQHGAGRGGAGRGLGMTRPGGCLPPVVMPLRPLVKRTLCSLMSPQTCTVPSHIRIVSPHVPTALCCPLTHRHGVPTHPICLMPPTQCPLMAPWP